MAGRPVQNKNAKHTLTAYISAPGIQASPLWVVGVAFCKNKSLCPTKQPGHSGPLSAPARQVGFPGETRTLPLPREDFVGPVTMWSCATRKVRVGRM